MSFQLVDAFGQTNSNFKLLNNNEYAYITGSMITIKSFKHVAERPIRYLESLNSGFTTLTYNKENKLLITAEGGIDTTISFYYYDSVASELSKDSNGLFLAFKFDIPESLNCEALDISNDGNLLCVLFNEPLFEVKVYDISNLIILLKEEVERNMDYHSYNFKIPELSVKEIISAKTDHTYSKISFNPLNSPSLDSLVLFSSTIISYIEITDAFSPNYSTEFRALNDDANEGLSAFNIQQDIQIRESEEGKVIKKYKILHKKADLESFEYVDYCWDAYSNIYVACSSSEIYLLNNLLEEVSPKFKEEIRNIIHLTERPFNLLYTQRYLLCTTDENRILYINPYIPPTELVFYKGMLGTEDKYQVFNVEKEYIINNLGVTSALQYDYKYQKIYATTKEGSFKIIPLQAEGLLRDKEKDEIENVNSTDNETFELECFEESKAHLFDIENPDSHENFLNKIIGIREIPNTTQLISIADDQKLIFWELAEKAAKSIHHLDYQPSCFEIDKEGQILVVGSESGVIRIYDISQKYVLRLIHQMRYLTKEYNKSIDRIIIQDKNKFISFCNLNDNLVYFISGEITLNYAFLGFIQTPMLISDICLIINERQSEELVVLCKQILLSYPIMYSGFIIDQKNAIKISNRSKFNIMNNYELNFEVKAKKIDSDLNYIVKPIYYNNDFTDFIWLVGEDRYFRLYKLPSELLASITENKKSPDKPLEEIIAHDLSVTEAISFGDSILSCSDDGTVQLRNNKKIDFKFRTHNFHKNGTSCIFFNKTRNLIFAGGQDGSIVVLGTNLSVTLPNEIINKLNNNEDLEIADVAEFISDEDLKSIEEVLHLEYLKIIKTNKRIMQGQMKEKLDSIKAELNKYISENSKEEEEIEQLKPEDMIINPVRIEYEKEQGVKQSKELNRRLFYELSERELYKKKLYENIYELMTTKTSQDKLINNNLKIYTNLAGDKELKSFALRKFTNKELQAISHAKQLRILELQDKYKRRDLGIPEMLDETKFTNMNEEYLVNRISAQVELKETEINPNDIMDHDGDGLKDDKAKFKAAKFKLQKDPYENFGVKFSKQDDNTETIKYKAEEQLLKEDLSVKYKTAVMPVVDIDIKINYKEIDTFNLLYSPFELYTTFRMRTQIFLILDIIQQLKHNFNKELVTFYENRQSLISKFNSNKQYLIENLSDVLTENIEEEYSISESPYADNDWVNKFSEKEITITKYYSKEEKELMNQESLIKEERIKALQGDTFEMRGLKNMIAPQIKKNKENMVEEEELIREPWMDKDNTKWTEDEIRRYNEYLKKEKDIADKREKIRSQKITKMNNIKMDMDNLKADMESKFLKMVKKKLYYDYKITEQEMYVLSLLRIQEYRASIKVKSKEVSKIINEKKAQKENFEKVKNIFEENINEFNQRLVDIEQRFAEKNKIKFDDFMIDQEEFTKEEKDLLKEIRLDPFYFEIKKRLKNNKKHGNKKYQEFNKSGVKEELIQLRNMNLYVSSVNIYIFIVFL